jgi:hypothetical protein
MLMRRFGCLLPEWLSDPFGLLSVDMHSSLQRLLVVQGLTQQAASWGRQADAS